MEKNIIPQVIMHYVLASLKILITWSISFYRGDAKTLSSWASELVGIILQYLWCYWDSALSTASCLMLFPNEMIQKSRCLVRSIEVNLDTAALGREHLVDSFCQIYK
jgi:hypothetical protein